MQMKAAPTLAVVGIVVGVVLSLLALVAAIMNSVAYDSSGKEDVLILALFALGYWLWQSSRARLRRARTAKGG